jgi:hypothetical protein
VSSDTSNATRAQSDVVTGRCKKIANLNAYHVVSSTDILVSVGETQNVPLAESVF